MALRKTPHNDRSQEEEVGMDAQSAVPSNDVDESPPVQSHSPQGSTNALQVEIMGTTGMPQQQRVNLVESESNLCGVQLVNTRRTNKFSDPMDLVELARQVQKAGEFTRANAGNKLTMIVEQMRYLQEQARKSDILNLLQTDVKINKFQVTSFFLIMQLRIQSIQSCLTELPKGALSDKIGLIEFLVASWEKLVLEEANRDAMLHQAACNLVKKPGTIYYLYERDSGQKYFSLLSPEEWGSSCPHEFIGAYKLEHDMSWTPFDKIQQRSNDISLIDKIMTTQKAITDASDMLSFKS